jgi:hypothetical protein
MRRIALICAGIVVLTFGVLLVRGFLRHKTVDVRNDSNAVIRVTHCVDDAADIGPGESFKAEGLPKDDRLYCRVGARGSSRCVAIPHVQTIRGSFLLSRAIVVPKTRCE